MHCESPIGGKVSITDSQLVAKQVDGSFSAKDHKIESYAKAIRLVLEEWP